MKKYFTLAVACTALFFCSCRKNDVAGTIANSTNSADAAFSAEASPLKLIPNKSVQYGALIEAPSAQSSTSFQLNVADQLGVSCLRARTLVPSTGTSPILNSKYKILLNFNCADNNGVAYPYVTDLAKYQTDLKKILAGFITMPVVAVIENEEANPIYHYGLIQDYIKQLNVAISVMHARGIKVANGGITCQGLNYLVYNDFIAQGKYDSAKQFQELTNVQPKAKSTKERGAVVDTLLNSYATMNLDYVNFHWKGTSPDTEALADVINYLKKRTNKKIITNEIGQFDKTNSTLQAHVQKCTDYDFPYILWYSPNEHGDKKATPLQYSTGSLTPTGITYKDYLKK